MPLSDEDKQWIQDMFRAELARLTPAASARQRTRAAVMNMMEVEPEYYQDRLKKPEGGQKPAA